MEANHSQGRQTALFRRLVWLVKKHHLRCDTLLESYGIGSGQIPVLMTLDRVKQITQRELAEQVHVTPATISGTLKRMERLGIISRSGREDDARISVVRLTDQGLSLVEETRRGFVQVDREMFDGFEPEDYNTLEGLLIRMQKNIKDTGESLPDFCQLNVEKEDRQ